MSMECFPATILPHVTALYRDYLAMGENSGAGLRSWFGEEPSGSTWMRGEVSAVDRIRLADALERQSVGFGASAAALANIERLRAGARAVVTGQQVGLLGGPLLTLLKAATAVSRARQATAATGVEHVPVFWLATEDHDLAEVDTVSLLEASRQGTNVETLKAGLKAAGAVPVGGVVLGEEMDGLLAQVSTLLGYAPVCEELRECYAAGQTLGGAFARWMAKVFAGQGLVVMDASMREFHALGAAALRFAIEHAEELEGALLERSEALVRAGYHAQVLVTRGASLLFLVDAPTGDRQALKRVGEGGWRAGGRGYSKEDLLGILESEPERLSPNALLRPVFQDTILPTAAYVGGPAEIAYFAQSEVLYRRILGWLTPVLPRVSATLLTPAVAAVMAKHEVTVEDVIAAKTMEALALRLGARAMPIALKRKLAGVGNAMEAELSALTEYMAGMDGSLGRSAEVSGSKMRYQMNRLRRMAATFELQKETSLRKHAEAIYANVFPGGHPQERVLAGVQFLAGSEGLVERLVEVAENACPGHLVVQV